MRCRHLNTSDKCGEATHDRIGDIIYEVEYRECLDCGTWLSLGESNDKPEAVRVEIRAAEIAYALHANVHDNERFIALTSFGERRGWAMHRAEQRADVEWGAYPDKQGQTGYLAREIATHSEES